MRTRCVITSLLVPAIWSGSANAQTRIIVRDTLGRQDLQNIRTGILEIQLCTVRDFTRDLDAFPLEKRSQALSHKDVIIS
jgi:hypothetical protein